MFQEVVLVARELKCGAAQRGYSVSMDVWPASRAPLPLPAQTRIAPVAADSCVADNCLHVSWKVLLAALYLSCTIPVVAHRICKALVACPVRLLLHTADCQRQPLTARCRVPASCAQIQFRRLFLARIMPRP
jgi:hypothetical protein